MDYGSEQGAEKAFQAFSSEICHADGTLIPLPHLNVGVQEHMFIAARYGEFSGNGQTASVLLIDLLSKRKNGEVHCVGRRDTVIANKIADSNQNQHGLLPAPNPELAIADEVWGKVDLGFYVNNETYREIIEDLGDVLTPDFDKSQLNKPAYHHRGIGALLLATSLQVLKSKGIETIHTPDLSTKAIKTYQSFGYDGKALDTPIDQLLENKYWEKTIKTFL